MTTTARHDRQGTAPQERLGKRRETGPLRPDLLTLRCCTGLLLCALVLLALAATPAMAAADAKKSDKVTFNFVDVELPTVTKFISEITGRNFIFDERVKGKITIIAPTKLSIEDAFSLFTSVLELKGFTVVPSGVDAYKIIPATEAKQRGITIGIERGPVNESYIAQLIPLRHVSSEDVLRFVQPIVSKDGHISTFGPGNVLLVIDSGLNVEKVLSLISAVDQPSGKEAPDTVLLRYAGADALAKILNDGFGRQRTRSVAGQQTIVDEGRAVADPRLNAIVLFGDRGSREAMKSLIALLDVAAPETTGRINVYFLENADAGELAKVLEGIIRGAQPLRQAGAQATPAVAPFEAAGGITVTADKSSNALVIVASPGDYTNLVGVIRQLDKRRRQVFVEAMIVEASIDRLTELGVKWRLTATKDGEPVAIGGFGTIDQAAIQGIIQGLRGATLGGLANFLTIPVSTIGADGTPVSSTLTIPGFAALFSLNEFKDAVSVLSTPQLLTSDNKEAEIVVGENVPYISRRESDPSRTVSVFSTVERKDVGIILRITPQVTEGDHVRLDIYQEISALKDEPQATVISVGPTWTRRATKTSVVVKDQQTVIIGGLIQDREEKSVTKIPILGDIPVLGWLFRSESVDKQKTNLLVFITPHVVKEAQAISRLTVEKHRAFAMTERLYTEGEMIVGFKDGLLPERERAIIVERGASVIDYILRPGGGVYHIRLRKDQTTEDGLREFSSLPEVRTAEPRYTVGLPGRQ